MKKIKEMVRQRTNRKMMTTKTMRRMMLSLALVVTPKMMLKMKILKRRKKLMKMGLGMMKKFTLSPGQHTLSHFFCSFILGFLGFYISFSALLTILIFVHVTGVGMSAAFGGRYTIMMNMMMMKMMMMKMVGHAW